MTSRGRPTIEEDDGALGEMARLITAAQAEGKYLSVRRAARMARDQLGMTGHSPSAIEGRLRRKFERHHDELLSAARLILSQNTRILSQASRTHSCQRHDMNAMSSKIQPDTPLKRTDFSQFPELVAAQQQRSTLRQRMKTVEAQLSELRAKLRDIPENGRAERAALREIDAVDLELEKVGNEYEAQTHRAAALKADAEAEILANVGPLHQQHIERMLQCATELERALAEETAFLEDLAGRGISTSVMTNVSAALRSSFGQKGRWSYGFDAFATVANQYLGRGEWKRRA